MKIVNLMKNKLADSKSRMGEGVLSLGEMLMQGLQVLVPGLGAGISLALGKLVLGGVLALVCLSVIVRLTLRRKNVAAAPSPRASLLLRCIALLLALGFSAAFVEMTNLPVRFNQAGFSFWYWFIVVAVIFVAYYWMRHVFSKIGYNKAQNEKALRLG
jgi:hypothetical protein